MKIEETKFESLCQSQAQLNAVRDYILLKIKQKKEDYTLINMSDIATIAGIGAEAEEMLREVTEEAETDEHADS